MTNGHELVSPASAGGVKTFDVLNKMVDVLGTTKTSFWPFLDQVIGSGSFGIWTYGEAITQTWLTSRDESANRNLNVEFEPYQHVGGVNSYMFTPSQKTYLSGQDEGNLGFPSNADFSCGAWILPRDVTDCCIMSKWDDNAQREWRLILDGNGKISLSTYDEANDESRTGVSDTVVPKNAWQFVVATTDNNDSDLSHTLYINGAADGSGNTESGAAFANSPDTSSIFTIGASGNTWPIPTLLFDGRIALPFVCGKELSANEVGTLYTHGKALLGL